MTNKKNLFKVIGATLLLVALASCGGASGTAQGGGGTSPSGNGGTTTSATTSSTTHKVVYKVEYTIYDDNFHKAATEISAKNTELGGFVLSSKENLDYANYVFRVVTEKLNDFITFVDSYNVGSKLYETQDITENYDDLQELIDEYEAKKASLEHQLANEDLSSEDRSSIQNSLDYVNNYLTKLYKEKNNEDKTINYTTVNIDFYKSKKTESELYWNDYFYYLKLVGKNLGTVLLYSAPFGAISGAAILVAFLIKKKKD